MAYMNLGTTGALERALSMANIKAPALSTDKTFNYIFG